jgi:hypothetical protein
MCSDPPNVRINMTRLTVPVVSSDRGPRRLCAVRYAYLVGGAG